MTSLFSGPGPAPAEKFLLASIILPPKLKKGPFNFLKLAVDYLFQKVYFSVYIETSRE
jgi:hypothetical protein